jgi:hypothetical protein
LRPSGQTRCRSGCGGAVGAAQARHWPGLWMQNGAAGPPPRSGETGRGQFCCGEQERRLPRFSPAASSASRGRGKACGRPLPRDGSSALGTAIGSGTDVVAAHRAPGRSQPALPRAVAQSLGQAPSDEGQRHQRECEVYRVLTPHGRPARDEVIRQHEADQHRPGCHSCQNHRHQVSTHRGGECTAPAVETGIGIRQQPIGLTAPPACRRSGGHAAQVAGRVPSRTPRVLQRAATSARSWWRSARERKYGVDADKRG